MEDTEGEYSNKEICLISSDGKRFNLSHDAGEYDDGTNVISSLLRCHSSHFHVFTNQPNCLNLYAMPQIFDNEIADIQLLKVGSTLLARVVEYLNQYKKHPMEHIITPLQEHTFEGLVKQQWYKDYVIQLDDAELRELKNAANYMGIGE